MPCPFKLRRCYRCINASPSACVKGRGSENEGTPPKGCLIQGAMRQDQAREACDVQQFHALNAYPKNKSGTGFQPVEIPARCRGHTFLG